MVEAAELPEDVIPLLAQIDAVIEPLPADDSLAEAINELDRLLDGGEGSLLTRYSRARLQEQAGLNTAARSYGKVARELADMGRWEAASLLARHALRLSPDPELIPLLLEASRNSGNDESRRADLQLAAHLAPHNPRVQWAQAQAAQAQGQTGRAAELTVRALRGFIESGQPKAAEDALLAALEEPSPTLAHHLLGLMPLMAEKKMLPLAEDALDLLEPLVGKFRLRQALSTTLEEMLRVGEATVSMRQRYVDAVAEIRGDQAAVKTAAEETKLTDPGTKFTEALTAFQSALSFARGALVKHRTWGVGRITSTNDQALIIDFPERRGQQMARSMARRSLTAVSPHSLEAVMFLRADSLKQEASQDAVGLMLRVIDESGGKASAPNFKKWLVGPVLTEGQWSAWWKGARESAAEDARIDHSNAFQGDYRRASGDQQAAVKLPPLNFQAGLSAAARMVMRLVDQHPELEEEAQVKYGPAFVSWAERDQEPEDQLAVGLLLSDWYPDQRDAWARDTARLLGEARGLNLLGSAAEQQAALELAQEAADPSRALVAALGSRFGPVRAHARTQLLRMGDKLPALLHTYLNDEQTPVPVQVEVIRLALELRQQGLGAEHDPWSLALAVIRALAHVKAQRDATSLKEMLAPQGEIAGLVRDHPRTKDMEINLELALLFVLRHGRRAPLVREFLTAVGAEELNRHLEEAHRPVEQEHLIPERDPKIVLMTRETYEGKVERREQLRKDLATEIPKKIAAARELGDLSENADYHAAKEQQGLADAEERSLEAMLDHARIIEDLRISDEYVIAGTEVTLLDAAGEERHMWILGQDDNHHGPEVVNYRAALGQAVVGRKRGEEVTLETETGPKTYKVVSIRKRLPETKRKGKGKRAGMFSD